LQVSKLIRWFRDLEKYCFGLQINAFPLAIEIEMLRRLKNGSSEYVLPSVVSTYYAAVNSFILFPLCLVIYCRAVNLILLLIFGFIGYIGEKLLGCYPVACECKADNVQ
jgi:hypothetical protein